MLLREAWGAYDPDRIARSITRQLQRNELSRLYHWRGKKLLAPSRLEQRT